MFVSTLSAELEGNYFDNLSRTILATTLNLEIQVLGSILIVTAFSFHCFSLGIM